MATLFSIEQDVYNNSGTSLNYKFKLEAVENSTSIDNNTSNVTIKLYARTLNSYAGYESYSSPRATISIDGTQMVTETVSSIISQTYKVIAQYTGNIAHNADGSKAITIVGAFNPNVSTSYLPKLVSITKKTDLTTIPRASTFTLNKSTMTYGDKITFTITRASSSFTHTIQMSCNGDSFANIATSVGTSYSYTLQTSVANRLTKSSNSVKFRVITYNGSTQIGYKDSSSVTITTPSNFAPTLAFDPTDVNGHVDKYGGYVKNKSQIKMKVTASLKYGASLTSLALTYNGKTSSTTSTSLEQTYTINSLNATSFSATAKDSRGMSTTNTQSITIFDCWNPVLNNISTFRCDSSGNADDEGAYIKVTFKYSIAPINNKNSKKYTIKYRESGTSTWTDLVSTATLSSYSGTISANPFSASTESPYEVQISLIDDFTTNSITQNVSTAFTLMDFGAGGKSMAIGKVSSNEGNFEVAMPMILSNHSSAVGTIQEVYNSSSYDKTSGGWADFTDVNLNVTSGTYVITFGMAWTANANGRRMIQLMESSNGTRWSQIPRSLIGVAPPNNNMTMAHTAIYQTSSNKQIKLQGLQDSGSTITMREGYIKLVRIV